MTFVGLRTIFFLLPWLASHAPVWCELAFLNSSPFAPACMGPKSSPIVKYIGMVNFLLKNRLRTQHTGTEIVRIYNLYELLCRTPSTFALPKLGFQTEDPFWRNDQTIQHTTSKHKCSPMYKWGQWTNWEGTKWTWTTTYCASDGIARFIAISAYWNDFIMYMYTLIYQ